MPAHELPEELDALLATFGTRRNCVPGFFSLREVTPAVRGLALARMAMEMRASSEDPGLIAAVSSLEKPLVYEAAYQTVCELYGG